MARSRSDCAAVARKQFHSRQALPAHCGRHSCRYRVRRFCLSKEHDAFCAHSDFWKTNLLLFCPGAKTHRILARMARAAQLRGHKTAGEPRRPETQPALHSPKPLPHERRFQRRKTDSVGRAVDRRRMARDGAIAKGHGIGAMKESKGTIGTFFSPVFCRAAKDRAGRRSGNRHSILPPRRAASKKTPNATIRKTMAVKEKKRSDTATERQGTRKR